MHQILQWVVREIQNLQGTWNRDYESLETFKEHFLTVYTKLDDHKMIYLKKWCGN